MFFPGGGDGNPLQDPCLANAMDREAWGATAHRVAKSQTQLRLRSADYCFSLIISFFPLYLYYSVSIASFNATQCFMLCVLGHLKHQETEKLAKS